MESMLRLLSTDNGSTPQLLPREELPTVQLPEIEISNDGTNSIHVLEHLFKHISYLLLLLIDLFLNNQISSLSKDH